MQRRFIFAAVATAAIIGTTVVSTSGADPAKPEGHPGNDGKTAMCQYTTATNTWTTVYAPTSQVGRLLAEGTYPSDTYNYGACLPA